MIHPGNRSETPDGVPLDLPMSHGLRTWGNNPEGEDTLLVGNYASVGEVGARMLDALPGSWVIRGSELGQPAGGAAARPARRARPGQASLLDRLLDALVVSAVQHWATHRRRPPAVAPAPATTARSPARWPSSTTTPRRLDPHLPGPSGRSLRAGFSRRFTSAVGESPIAYLSAWRLALAADLLAGTDDTVAAISRSVGYTSPFTFSDAFKRSYGVSPVEHRRRGRAG